MTERLTHARVASTSVIQVPKGVLSTEMIEKKNLREKLFFHLRFTWPENLGLELEIRLSWWLNR